MPLILESVKRSEILPKIDQLLTDSFIFGLEFGRFQDIHKDEEVMLQHLILTKVHLQKAETQNIDIIRVISEFLHNPKEEVICQNKQFKELIQKKITSNGIQINILVYSFDSLIRHIQTYVFQEPNSDPIIPLQNAFLLGIECARRYSIIKAQDENIVRYLKRVHRLITKFDNLHQALNQIQIRNSFISECITSQNQTMEDLLNTYIETMTIQLNPQSIINIIEEPIQCKICLNPCDTELYISFSDCSHCFHRECLLNYCSNKIFEQQFPITCPIVECKAEIIDRDLQNILDPNQYEEYLSKSIKRFIESNPNEYSSCPTAGCQNMFGKRGNYFKCTYCDKQYCLECRVEYHVAQSCEEFRAQQIREKDPDYQFLKFVQGQNFRQCPQCQFWIEKSQGCNHMSCRCKYQFCYACGGPYPNCHCINNVRALVRLL